VQYEKKYFFVCLCDCFDNGRGSILREKEQSSGAFDIREHIDSDPYKYFPGLGNRNENRHAKLYAVTLGHSHAFGDHGCNSAYRYIHSHIRHGKFSVKYGDGDCYSDNNIDTDT
jgi:hypothetical protein